jgi:hypothetical protein
MITYVTSSIDARHLLQASVLAFACSRYLSRNCSPWYPYLTCLPLNHLRLRISLCLRFLRIRVRLNQRGRKAEGGGAFELPMHH